MIMTKSELFNVFDQEFENIKDLFERKNVSYGAKGDAFYNFRQTASRVFSNFEPAHGMFRVMLALKDKHDVALANLGLDDPECESRLRDVILYCLIGLAMCREYRGQ